MSKRAYAHRTFAPATDKKIAAAEMKFGIKFLDDYKAFLKADNGLIINEPDPDGDNEDWINEVTRVFGLNHDTYTKFDSGLNGHLDPRLLKLFYSVGIDSGGNDLVQITAGKYRGELAMLDHEAFGGIEDLLEVQDFTSPAQYRGTNKFPFKTFGDATPDQILEECFKNGYLTHYPLTFGEQIKALDKLYNQIALKNKTRPKEVVQTRAKVSSMRLYRYKKGEPYSAEKLDSFHGTLATIQPDEGLGARFKIRHEEDRDLNIETTITVDDTRIVYHDISTNKTNTKYQRILPMSDGTSSHQSGKYEIKLNFPDNSELAPVSKFFRITVAQRDPDCTTCLSFEPATETEIARVENKLPYAFCEDFRLYLKSENGRHFSWPRSPLWKKINGKPKKAGNTKFKILSESLRPLMKSEDRKRFFGFPIPFAKRSSNDHETGLNNQFTNADWELAITEIYGLQKPWTTINHNSGQPEKVDVERGLTEKINPNSNWSEINPVLCPIADDTSENAGGWYQIVAGQHRGKIAYCRKFYYTLNYIFQIKDYQRVEFAGNKSVTKSYPFEDIDKATPDQIIDAYLADKFIEITDMDFTTFRKLIVSAHETEFVKRHGEFTAR